MRASPAPVEGSDLYGPAERWDPRLRGLASDLVTATPSGDFVHARDAPNEIPPLLRQITCRCNLIAAGHELTTAPAETILEVGRRNLTRARWIELGVMANSGHNHSLGRDARSYHLRVSAFAEGVLAG